MARSNKKYDKNMVLNWIRLLDNKLATIDQIHQRTGAHKSTIVELIKDVRKEFKNNEVSL